MSYIQLTLPLSDEDAALLRVLLGDSAPPPMPVPVKKAAPAKAAPAKAKAAPAKAAPEEDEEDLLGSGGDEGDYTMKQAVEYATEASADGRREDIKAALQAAGAARVSQLKNQRQINVFVKSLLGSS